MKKYLSIILIAVLLTAAGCSSSNEPAANTAAVVQNKEKDTTTAENSTEAEPTVESTVSDFIDLTALSSTMVYAEVYNIMVTPDAYIGKTIKMRGSYYASYYEETGLYYHFIIIADAAACCSQGLEFELPDSYRYPADYPADGTLVTVTGTFQSYQEGEQTYYHIVTDAYEFS